MNNHEALDRGALRTTDASDQTRGRVFPRRVGVDPSNALLSEASRVPGLVSTVPARRGKLLRMK